jgi:integrase
MADVPQLSQCGDVSLPRGEIILRAEHTKDRENRIIPISSRFREVLAMRRDSPAGVPFPSSADVFGDEIGQRVGNVRRAWQRAVLRAHGHTPAWRRRSDRTTKAARG